jgi:hypothetical protein
MEILPASVLWKKKTEAKTSTAVVTNLEVTVPDFSSSIGSSW